MVLEPVGISVGYLSGHLSDCLHICSFINSMPMVFAFRIIDCFFCMGPKVLFQVGSVHALIILRILSTDVPYDQAGRVVLLHDHC